MDTKFHIRKLAQFRPDRIVSFEKLIPTSVNLDETYEGLTCIRHSISRVDSLLGAGQQKGALLLVPDEVSEKRLVKYREDYASSQVVSCYWFYFSALLQYELPVEPF